MLFFGGVLAALGAQLLFQLGIVELLDALLNVEHPVQVAVDDLAADLALEMCIRDRIRSYFSISSFILYY